MKKVIARISAFKQAATNLAGRIKRKETTLWKEVTENWQAENWQAKEYVLAGSFVVGAAASIAAWTLLSPWAAIPIVAGISFGIGCLDNLLLDVQKGKKALSRAVIASLCVAAFVGGGGLMFSSGVKDMTDKTSRENLETSVKWGLFDLKDWAPLKTFTVEGADPDSAATITRLWEVNLKDVFTGTSEDLIQAEASLSSTQRSFWKGTQKRDLLKVQVTRPLASSDTNPIAAPGMK